MKTSTNAKMIKDGMTTWEILEVLEYNLLKNMDNIVDETLRFDGDEDSEELIFQDYKGREFHLVIYNELPNKIFLSTLTIGDEEFEDKNEKSFSSVGAAYNAIERMVA